MDTPKRRFPILPTLAGIALLALLALPATHWLFLAQFRMALLQTERSNPEATVQAAQSHPYDYPIQLANALNASLTGPSSMDFLKSTDNGRQRLLNLQALTARFPDTPSSHATLLRYLTMGQVRMHRDEEALYAGQMPARTSGATRGSDPEYLAMFERAAEAGERLDPENAYFPMMRAVGLFESYQDSEALSALQRAGSKSYWEDYAYDEARGRTQLYTEAYGERGAIGNTAIQAAIVFPHFSALRSLARMAMYEATEAERNGHAREGVAIRHAVMRSGGLMRVHARSYIGTLVGIAISAIGTGRPGGAPAVKAAAGQNQTEEQRKQSQQERLNRYYAYLRSIGQEDEARWAQAEIAAGIAAREIGTKGLEQHPFNGHALSSLLAFWAANMVMLSNILFVLALGGAAWLATKITLRKGLFWLRLTSCLLIAGAALLWQYKLFDTTALPFFTLSSMMSNMSEQQETSNVHAAAYFLLALSLAVPLLTLLILTIVSKVERIPIATGVGRGLRRVALPLASLLLLGYGGLLFGTLRQEAKINTALQSIQTHEGSYFAELAGRAWPGMTP